MSTFDLTSYFHDRTAQYLTTIKPDLSALNYEADRAADRRDAEKLARPHGAGLYAYLDAEIAARNAEKARIAEVLAAAYRYKAPTASQCIAASRRAARSANTIGRYWPTSSRRNTVLTTNDIQRARDSAVQRGLYVAV